MQKTQCGRSQSLLQIPIPIYFQKKSIFGNANVKKSEFSKKNRHKDVAAQQSENFASQNSRQESENPRMDFRFHVFGNANVNLSEKSKKKIRHIEHYRCCARLDAAEQQGENFAEQNSRQESENLWMDFRFHIFSQYYPTSSAFSS